MLHNHLIAYKKILKLFVEKNPKNRSNKLLKLYNSNLYRKNFFLNTYTHLINDNNSLFIFNFKIMLCFIFNLTIKIIFLYYNFYMN